MSLFDYPRINITGTVNLNPGTANNDDYAAEPTNYLPFSNQVVALVDGARRKAR